MILIFDKKGNYRCEVKGLAAASKETGAIISTISKVMGSYVNTSANGFYFVKKDSLTTNGPDSIKIIQDALKIVIACQNEIGLKNKLNQIIKLTSK